MKFSFKQALSNDKHTYKKVGRGLSMNSLPLLLLQSLLTVVPSIAGNSVRLTVRAANKFLNNQFPCIHTPSRHKCSTDLEGLDQQLHSQFRKKNNTNNMKKDPETNK